MRKRIFAVLVALITVFTLCGTAFASNGPMKGPQYIYKATYFDTAQKSIYALAANQDPEGAYFNSAMSIHYSLSGGATATGSVQVSLPYPYDMISFSASIGSKSSGVTEYSTGLESGQPAGNYFLLITKYYYVNPYVVYRRRAGTADVPANWVIDHTGATLEYRYHSPRLITYAEARNLGLK